jgi:hypothetical protein
MENLGHFILYIYIYMSQNQKFQGKILQSFAIKYIDVPLFIVLVKLG